MSVIEFSTLFRFKMKWTCMFYNLFFVYLLWLTLRLMMPALKVVMTPALCLGLIRCAACTSSWLVFHLRQQLLRLILAPCWEIWASQTKLEILAITAPLFNCFKKLRLYLTPRMASSSTPPIWAMNLLEGFTKLTAPVLLLFKLLELLPHWPWWHSPSEGFIT